MGWGKRCHKYIPNTPYMHTYNIHTMLVNNARNPDLGNVTYSYFTYLLLLTYLLTYTWVYKI